MNKPAWLFGGSTLLLGASCLYLLFEPRAERAGAQADSELNSELTQLRADRDRLETDVRSMRAAQVAPALAPQPTAAAVSVSTAPAPAMPPMRPDISPKSRRIMARMRNGKMFKQLGLSAAQEESLLDVLAVQEERMMAMRVSDPTARPDALRATNRAEVAAVIGSESAEKLDAWQQAQSARMEIRRVRDQLEDVGEPLSAAQLTRIEELIHARPSLPAPIRMKEESGEAFMDRFKGWRQESREQIRAELSPVLEPRQLERYDELDDMSRSFEKNMSLTPPPPRVNTPPAVLTAGRAAPPVR